MSHNTSSQNSSKRDSANIADDCTAKSSSEDNEINEKLSSDRQANSNNQFSITNVSEKSVNQHLE